MSEPKGPVDVQSSAVPSPNVQLAIFLRRGPYVLLVLSSIAAALSVRSIRPNEGEIITVTVLVPVLAALHWICADRRWGRDLIDATGAFYVATRTVVAFVITWISPFFAIFALIGYFDNQLYVPRRWARVVLLVTAVTMAGSQSGGLPPQSTLQFALFVGLLGLNGVLTVVLTNADAHEARVAAERDSTIEKLERALAENAELQARLVEQARESGVHDERERLALEIHDTIAQNLTGIVTQLQAVTDTSDGATSREHVKRAADLAREALGEARRSVQGLLPLRLDGAGLVDALTHLVRDWSTTTGISSELVVTGEAESLHADIEATVLRVAQEALTNVGKYAHASRVGVTLSYTDDELVLDVRDDGTGFDPAAAPTPAGHGVGLHGMQQRAARVAGELVIESEPGAGTAISLRVPSVRHD